MSLNLTALAKATDAFNFKAAKIGGSEVDFAKQYSGKVLLIANTASKCGYTPQLGGLQILHEKYSAKGLVVLAFPSNDFDQEYSDDIKIGDVCQKYAAKFTVFRPIHVQGKDIHPLFKHLQDFAGDKGSVKWNFEKFLVAKDGTVISRYRSNVDPTSADVVKAVEAALAAK